jgi:two-component system OmpR family sensor kinase
MRELLRRTRVRLTLVNVAIFAVVASLAALGFWAAFAVSEYQTVDASLTAQSRLLQSQIEQSSGQFGEAGEPPLPGETQSGIAVGAMLLASDGRVLDQSGQIRDAAGLAAVARRPGSAVGCCRTAMVAGQSVRLLVMPVELGNGTRGSLLLARPIGELQESLLRVAGLLVLVAGVLVAGAGGLGYWLAGRALRPVRVMAGTAREISEQDLHRRIQLDLPAGDELGELAETFNGMLARLESAFEGLRRFTADAAHEFRAPLALMRTQVEVTLRRPRSAHQHEASQHALLIEIQRLSRLADQLLLLARADAGALEPRREAVDLPEFMEATIERWRPAAREAEVQLESQLPLEGSLAGDPDLLRQLLDNLIDNAIRYTPAGGTVSVSAGERGGWWLIGVQDSGPGIDRSLRPRLFERFARADGARARSTGGAGLGLSLCAAIAAAHGGSMVVENSPSGGARFVARLPAMTPTEGVEAPQAAAS